MNLDDDIAGYGELVGWKTSTKYPHLAEIIHKPTGEPIIDWDMVSFEVFYIFYRRDLLNQSIDFSVIETDIEWEKEPYNYPLAVEVVTGTLFDGFIRAELAPIQYSWGEPALGTIDKAIDFLYAETIEKKRN